MKLPQPRADFKAQWAFDSRAFAAFKMSLTAVLGAWSPAADAATRASAAGKSSGDCLNAAVEAARQGRESTKAMQARLGRAAKLGERSIGSIDAGAASAVMLLEAMASVARERTGP